MKNITNYYVEDKSKLISNKDAYIVGKKFRITVLSHRLVRIEYSEKGLFEDRPTSLIINRSFPKIDYFITESDSMIEINTGVFTLTYVKDSPIKSGILSSNIKAVINGTKKEWQINNPEVRNLRGINYSIDSVKDKIVLDKGLYSLDGFCLLDDSRSLVLDENDMFIERDKDIKDLYLFMYDNDFEGCLSDYFTLTGYPSMIPRYALGAWWYKNNNYKEEEIKELVDRFNHDNIPISIFLLGDYWHDQNNGYTPSINLKNISNYLNSNNIKLGVTINPKYEIKEGSNDYQLISNYIKTNKLGVDDLRFTPGNNIITSSIGDFMGPKIDVYWLNNNDYKALILCSDGVSDVLSSREIRDTVINNKDNIANKMVGLVRSKTGYNYLDVQRCRELFANVDQNYVKDDDASVVVFKK